MLKLVYSAFLSLKIFNCYPKKDMFSNLQRYVDIKIYVIQT